MVLELIIAATVAVSLVSLVGVLVVSGSRQEQTTLLLVSLAAGTLLGAAFLDLLPHAVEQSGEAFGIVFQLALLGFLVFFVLEKIIHWHHHHAARHEYAAAEKPVGYLNLIGDALHNFFDGIAIAAGFLLSPAVGITTTIAVALHEIPQEIGDFSLLIYSGFSRAKAIYLNLLSALAAIAGALVFYFAAPLVENLEVLGLAFTGGMFIYLAAADIVPELQREKTPAKSAMQFAAMFTGIAVIWLVATFLE